jgi:predicted enzyme related to lactoylglutathione lyase
LKRATGSGGIFFIAQSHPKRQEYDYGRFAWILDPEGNRIEL